jgi:hypothetical protein
MGLVSEEETKYAAPETTQTTLTLLTNKQLNAKKKGYRPYWGSESKPKLEQEV